MENMTPGAVAGQGKGRESTELDSADNVDSWLSHISGQMSFFVRGRIKMIELYPFARLSWL